MSFKQVTNLKSGRNTFYIDGRRVSETRYLFEALDLTGYNSACDWTERGRHYHAFFTSIPFCGRHA